MSELQIQDITSLDYLVQMLEMAYRTNQMERVIHIADHLYSCTTDVYTQIQFLKAKNRKKRITINRPLVYYFGKSHLMKGLALQKLERYEESLLSIDKYQELGWFIGLDAGGSEVVEDFRNFATANRYAVQILMGHKEVLDEYIAFLLNQPEEIIPECITILEAAIAHGWQIEEYLEKILPYNESFAMLEESENVSLFVHYMYCLALYKMPICKSDAINALISGIAVSCKINLEAGFRKSCALFESMRESATEKQITQYKNILKGVLSNEKNYAYIRCHV
ncbi:DNA-binding protein [Paenibacillus polysaccharolyticus]|uniref:DNA-binding protein n=1 Tax=Paenibacillus polysaccharolyticus TaxID=582692 RepID=UPI0020A0EE7C|nr:DNA-binding protein [Paenibacillus polysaccharolyticus]MCP1131835.1 DNA-binding protein [Paenibacillus polysaccharolyticus]